MLVLSMQLDLVINKESVITMFSFLQPKEAKSSVPQSMIMNLYYKCRFQSLLGIYWLCVAYYIVRNNFCPYQLIFYQISYTLEQNGNRFAI